MKYRILLFLSAVIMFAAQPSFAAFPIKSIPATEDSVVTAANELTAVLTPPQATEKHATFSESVKRMFHKSDIERRDNHTKKGGINGLLSMIFGIAGILTISWLGGILLGIPAIILGVIGMKRHEQFSVTGLILGIVGVTLTLLLLVLAVAIIAAIL